MDTAMLQQMANNIRVSAAADLLTLFVRPSQRKTLRLFVDSRDPSLAGFGDQVEGEHRKLASKVWTQKSPLYASDDNGLPPTLAARYHALERVLDPPERMRSVAALQINAEHNVIGVLLLAFRQPQPFDTPQRLVIEALARQAALWVQQSHASAAFNQRHVQELEDLQAVDREIMRRSLDLEKVLDIILASAARHVRAVDGMIALLNSATGDLEARAVIGRDPEQRRTWKAAPDQRSGVTQRAFSTRQPVRVDNLHTSKVWRKIHNSRASSTVSELAVPLIDEDEPVGVIDFESAEVGAFSAADEDFLVTLAGQAVLAIRNAEAYERARRDADERQTLIDVGKEITRQLEPVQTFSLILQKAVAITGATAGTLHLVDRRKHDLWVAAEEGGRDPDQRLRQAFNEGVVGRAASTGRLVNAGDVTQSPWAEVYIPFIPGIHSELAAPLFAADGVRGVINVESRERDCFGHRDEQMLIALADLAVIAIENAERYQQAEDSRRRIETLHEIDLGIINQFDDPQSVIHTILSSALQLTGADAGDLYLYQAGSATRSYSLRADQTGTPTFARTDAPGQAPVPSELVDDVARTRTKRRTPGHMQAVPQSVAGRPDAGSAVAVPLLASDELVGVLQLESAAPNMLHDEDIDVLDLIAGQAVIAIQNAEGYARAARESWRFSRLYQTAQQLGEITDLDQIEHAYDAVFTIASAVEANRQVVLRRYDPERRELIVVRSVAGHPISAPDIPTDQGANGWVARTLRLVVIPDTANPPPHLADVPNRQVQNEQSLVVIPIVCEGIFYGSLTLSHEQRNHFLRFEEADLQLYEELAHQLALTLHRHEAARLRRTAERRAVDAETVGEIGQLTLDLAHRLKENLGIVDVHVKSARLALDGPQIDRARANEALDKIVRDVGTALALGNTLLETASSAFKGPDRASRKTRTPVGELFETAAHSYPDLPSYIKVAVEAEPAVDKIDVLPHHVDVILHHLFVNAVEAMPDGGTIIFRALDAGDSVIIQVVDSGPGIPAKWLASIFNPFSTTKGKGSWGVGLWSARLHARRAGGELTVESTDGKGTTFTLRLPKE